MNADLLTTQPQAWRVTTSAPDGRAVSVEVVDEEQVDALVHLRLLMTVGYPDWTVRSEAIT